MSQGTALITGASNGIGAIYADRLAHRGYDLILVARDATRLAALAERLRFDAGVRVELHPADLTNRSQLAEVEAGVASIEKLTLLVNNAGIALEGTLIDTPPGMIEELIAINVTAPTSASDRNHWLFRHSSRRRPSNDFTKALSVDLACELGRGAGEGDAGKRANGAAPAVAPSEPPRVEAFAAGR